MAKAASDRFSGLFCIMSIGQHSRQFGYTRLGIVEQKKLWLREKILFLTSPSSRCTRGPGISLLLQLDRIDAATSTDVAKLQVVLRCSEPGHRFCHPCWTRDGSQMCGLVISTCGTSQYDSPYTWLSSSVSGCRPAGLRDCFI